MPDLTDDEYTILMLADQGQNMMAIARWEKPTDSLVAKGLLTRRDKLNHEITDAGRKAVKERAKGDDKAFDDAARNWLNQGIQQRNLQTQAYHSLEQAAIHLSHLIRTSCLATGDTPEAALRNWLPILSEKVQEKLRG